MSNRAKQFSIITIRVVEIDEQLAVKYQMAFDKQKHVHGPFVPQDWLSDSIVQSLVVGKRYAIKQAVGQLGTVWYAAEQLDPFGNHTLKLTEGESDEVLQLLEQSIPDNLSNFFNM